MFRFSVRDLFWLILVVATNLGWLVSAINAVSVGKLQAEAAKAEEVAKAHEEAADARAAAATARREADKASGERNEERYARRFFAAKLLDAMERLGEFDPKNDPRPRWAN